MKLVTATIGIDELRNIMLEQATDMVKIVVDIKRRVLAIGADLHSDLEAFLLQDGSVQADLWGINLHPDEPAEGFVEYDSLINIRSSQGNRSRSVESPELRQKIAEVVAERVLR